jgi:molybdopterin biosynthesis enzyme
VVETGGRGSHVISGVANADAFAVLPRGVELVSPGEPVVLELFKAVETRPVGDE